MAVQWAVVPFPPEPTVREDPPAEGWHRPCTIAGHRWALEIESGRASLVCLDPCTDEQKSLMRALRKDRFGSPYFDWPTPGCEHWFESDDLHMDPIPVRWEVIDDSTPSTPAGPAEYGYWIEIEPLPSGPLSAALETLQALRADCIDPNAVRALQAAAEALTALTEDSEEEERS